jgi:hypothetical protein
VVEIIGLVTSGRAATRGGPYTRNQIGDCHYGLWPAIFPRGLDGFIGMNSVNRSVNRQDSAHPSTRANVGPLLTLFTLVTVVS